MAQHPPPPSPGAAGAPEPRWVLSQGGASASKGIVHLAVRLPVPGTRIEVDAICGRTFVHKPQSLATGLGRHGGAGWRLCRQCAARAERVPPAGASVDDP